MPPSSLTVIKIKIGHYLYILIDMRYKTKTIIKEAVTVACCFGAAINLCTIAILASERRPYEETYDVSMFNENQTKIEDSEHLDVMTKMKKKLHTNVYGAVGYPEYVFKYYNPGYDFSVLDKVGSEDKENISSKEDTSSTNQSEKSSNENINIENQVDQENTN